MRITSWQRLHSARTVLEFCHHYPDVDLALLTAVAWLEQIVERVRALLREQLHARQEAELARVAMNAIGGELVEQLRRLVRLTRVVARKEHEAAVRISVRFRMSCDSALAEAVRVAFITAAPHEKLLCRHGMPRDLPGALRDGLVRYLAASDRHARAVAAAQAAASGLKQLAPSAQLVMRRLDDSNRIRFRTDPERLAEWHSALHGRWGVRLAG